MRRPLLGRPGKSRRWHRRANLWGGRSWAALMVPLMVVVVLLMVWVTRPCHPPVLFCHPLANWGAPLAALGYGVPNWHPPARGPFASVLFPSGQCPPELGRQRQPALA